MVESSYIFICCLNIFDYTFVVLFLLSSLQIFLMLSLPFVF